MKTKTETYDLDEKIAIEVYAEPSDDGYPYNEKCLIFWGPEKEQEIEGEKETVRDVLCHFEFKNDENLKLAQMGLELIEKSINLESDDASFKQIKERLDELEKKE